MVLPLIFGVVFSGHTTSAHTRRVCSTQRARARGGSTCPDRVCQQQRGAGARCHGGGPAGRVPRGAACPQGGGRFPCHPPGTGHFLRSRAGVAAPGPPPGPVPLPGTGESREASAAPPARAPVSAPGEAPRSGWGRRDPRATPRCRPRPGARRAPHPGTPTELISFAGPGRPRVTGMAPGLSGRGEPLSGPGRSPPGPPAPQPRGRDALPRPRRNEISGNQTKSRSPLPQPPPARRPPAPHRRPPSLGLPVRPSRPRAVAGLRAPNESSAVGLPRAGQRGGPGSPGPPCTPGTQFRASSPPRTLVLGTPRCDPASRVPAPWVLDPKTSLLGSLLGVQAIPLPPKSPGTGVRCPHRDLSPPPARSVAHRSSRSQKQSLGGGGRNAEGRGAGCTLTERVHKHPQQVPTAPQVPTGQGEPPDHGLGLSRCCPGAVRCLVLSPNPTTHPHQDLC